MVPDEDEGWVELYGDVLRTGKPIRFERELLATRRHLELAAFRIEPASRKQVAVLFQDITGRKRAEEQLRLLNHTLETRIEAALSEKKLLADLVEGTDAFVHVADRDFRWLAINKAAKDEFRAGVRHQAPGRHVSARSPRPSAGNSRESRAGHLVAGAGWRGIHRNCRVRRSWP